MIAVTVNLTEEQYARLCQALVPGLARAPTLADVAAFLVTKAGEIVTASETAALTKPVLLVRPW
jgi:hypothetical protein